MLLEGDARQQLSKHLLKTVCTDLTNLIFNLTAADHMMSLADETQFTPEVRTILNFNKRLEPVHGGLLSVSAENESFGKGFQWEV